MRHRWLWIGAAATAAALLAWALWPAPPVATEDHAIEVTASDQPVMLDTRLYLPPVRTDRVPAVLLAHGLGGTKDSVSEEAEALARDGYVVLTWTARGFGASGGVSHLNHPDYEVLDAIALVDWLAARPEVESDAPGDPRVGVVGSSYGGALALWLAGLDHRIDAIVPRITWNDLAKSLSGSSGESQGALKQLWVGTLFGAGFGAEGTDACGRWAPDVCRAYFRMGGSSVLDEDIRALLELRSPDRVLDQISAPTLLIQGSADSLFPLDQADANAAGIRAAGTPVQVAWFTGGHDGGSGPPSDRARSEQLTRAWLTHHLSGRGPAPEAEFTFSRLVGLDPVERSRLTVSYQMADYPGLAGDTDLEILVSGGPRTLLHPPGGSPAAVGSLPSELAEAISGMAVEIPGQFGRWASDSLRETVTVVGTPTARIRAASPTGSALLFIRLEVLDEGGEVVRRGLTTPVRLEGLGDDLTQATPREVVLAGMAEEVEAGQAVAVAISTTDQIYRTGAEAASYTVDVDGDLTLPAVDAAVVGGGSDWWATLAAGMLVAVVLVGTAAVVVSRRRRRKVDADAAGREEMPLRVRGLRKAFDGLVAVDGADFMVERGQVVGLLGPNGAGKTTALRVILGLIPAEGDVSLFGRPLRPGASILCRVGALVEGPGFLPHLSGRRNLEYYWAATGLPPEAAGFERVMELAGLGDAIDRRVKQYSHGMRQRLAVAQAMLGMPELLILDEPTDGLDPPQIAAMRRVLRDYARDGRSVLVSSHLLAEVEQTCSHVVVMHRGRVVASGPVREVVGEGTTTAFEVSDVDAAREVAGSLNLQSESESGDTLVVEMGDTPRHRLVEALVAAGVSVEGVTPRRRLEEAFLALVGMDDTARGPR
ncbi:MAG TPA: alpha/beta fold hydrolase [Acidimicrobiia bacterium]|nr:alpha/beta fold hydrolase [Acidimicrobiia bacterium]